MKKSVFKGGSRKPAKKAPYPSLTILKRSSTQFSDSPKKAMIEAFENAYKSRDYCVTFECPEFTSLCPITRQPDFGRIAIKYIPDKLCVESKALKLYLFSYRNHNTFHEEAVNAILEDIAKACSPRWIEVTGVFRPRGGISITVVAEAGRRPRG